MSEVYTFDNLNNFNQEFHDKLIIGYHAHKITIYFDKEIINIKNIQNLRSVQGTQTQLCGIRIGSYDLELYTNSYEFINNIFSFTVSSINTEYQYNKKNSIRISCDINSQIKSFNIEIKKNDFMICSSRNLEMTDLSLGKYIIKSDFFKTFDDLIKYIMNDSGLSYDLSKKYLTDKIGTYNYYNDEHKYNKDSYILDEGFNENKLVINSYDSDDDY